MTSNTCLPSRSEPDWPRTRDRMADPGLAPSSTHMPESYALDGSPDLDSYDVIAVAMSFGKDSIATLLTLLERGVDPSRIELHHHDIDGDGPLFMDWACTRDYGRQLAAALRLPLYFSYREGGLHREMHRQNTPTAPVAFETPDGEVRRAGGGSGRLGTRLRFPQVTASLMTRYCSAYGKIGVMDALISNQDRFLGKRTLVCTGERAAESPARSRYPVFERHRTDTRLGSRRRRHVDHWRPVHGWSEEEVWRALERHGIVPHVAYQLGWSRLSCMTCIFVSPNCWATIRLLFPERFEFIAERERAFGFTIQRHASVVELADRGTPYRAALGRPDLIAQAVDPVWRLPSIIARREWRLPAGAYGDQAGPT